MRIHGPVIAHCADSEEFPNFGGKATVQPEGTAGYPWQILLVTVEFLYGNNLTMIYF